MELNIQTRKKKNKKGILFVIILLLLCIPGYFIYKEFLNSKEDIEQESTQDTDMEEEIVQEEEEIPQGPAYQEFFPIIEEQQAYVVIPRIDKENPPTLVIYSHGSNTTVTQNMEDQFMKDMQAYGIFFTEYNYIFSASNQHGVNWGSSAAIQDTINLKNWVDENYDIQPKVYLIGFSMGGLPTMNFATTYPDIISKIALLAPTVKSSEWNQTRADKLKDIDIKLWHGNKDVNVPYSYSVYFVNKLKGYGKDIEFITLESKTHFDIDTEYMNEILEFFETN
ncbi:MAG TPA: alpha/beta fold hydrolase [Candidatus Dojkabacteria bacterium]|nr:alpha/beta fold hydrolase [Candidatus Dojkabacteria bacterium]